MTFVGHSLAGASIAIIALVPNWSIKKKFILSASFILLANFPDLKLPHWGHDRYDISHSIFTNLLLITLSCLALYLQRKIIVKWNIIALASIAWLSHLLLDTFYNHGYGLRMFWPFSNGSLSLAMPWFEILKGSLLSNRSLKIYSVELIFYGLIFLFIFYLKTYLNKKRKPKLQ